MTKKKKNPAAQELGRLGGKARAKKLTEAKRREIASMGGTALWDKLRTVGLIAPAKGRKGGGK